MEGTTTGPATFSEAFAADASSASSPSTDTTAASASTATTEPSAVGASPEASPQQPTGEPPRERWADILNNTRDKTRAEVLAEWRQQHGWAESVDRRAVEQAVRLAQTYQQDPSGYIRGVLAEGLANPQLAPLIRSELGRLLAQRQGASDDGEPQADIPVEFPDGSTKRVFSAEQLAKREAWLQQRWMGQVEQRMAPALGAAEKLQQQEAQHQAHAWSSGFVGEIAAYPGFAEHKAAIGQEVARVLNQHAGDRRVNDPSFLEAVTLRAYTKLVTPTLAQSAGKAAEKKLLDDLNTKAAASTSPNPGSAAPSSAKPITSFHDKGLQWR